MPASAPDVTPKESALVVRRNGERNTSKRRRSRSQGSESRTRCYFCDKNGHVQLNCLQYLKARDKIRRRMGGKKDKTSDSEESESESDNERSSGRKSKGKRSRSEGKDKEARTGIAIALYGNDNIVHL